MFLVFLRNCSIALALTVFSGLYLPKDTDLMVDCKTGINRMQFPDHQNPNIKKYIGIHLCMKHVKKYIG